MTIFWMYVCYNMAVKRGRDGVYGALFGGLFGIFAVIGYWIAGDKTPPSPPVAGAY